MPSAEKTLDFPDNGQDEDALYSKYKNGVPDERDIDQVFAMQATNMRIMPLIMKILMKWPMIMQVSRQEQSGR